MIFLKNVVSNVYLPDLYLKHIREEHPPQEIPAIEEFKMHTDSLFININSFFKKSFFIFLGNHTESLEKSICLFQSF